MQACGSHLTAGEALRQLQCFKVNYLPLQHTSTASNKLHTRTTVGSTHHAAETVDLNHQAKALWRKAQPGGRGFPGSS